MFGAASGLNSFTRSYERFRTHQVFPAVHLAVCFTGTLIQNIVNRHISSRTQWSFGAGTNNIDSICRTCFISFIQICFLPTTDKFQPDELHTNPDHIGDSRPSTCLSVPNFQIRGKKSDRIISRDFIKRSASGSPDAFLDSYKAFASSMACLHGLPPD